jgi:hypothetical protein
MKSTKTFYYCEYCNEEIEKEPFFDEHFKNGLIRIKEGTMLLTQEIVQRDNLEFPVKNIDGYYCNLECLISHLKKILYN